MLLFDQKPELFKINKMNINIFSSSDSLSDSIKIDDEEYNITKIVKPKTIEISEFSINSQILVTSALKTLSLTDSHEIILLSLSDGNMDLEILGGKTMNAPIDSIGDVLNYSLRQVPGESRFKHGYLVQYKNPSKIFIEGTSVEVDSLKRYIENIQNSLFKEFTSK